MCSAQADQIHDKLLASQLWAPVGKVHLIYGASSKTVPIGMFVGTAQQESNAEIANVEPLETCKSPTVLPKHKLDDDSGKSFRQLSPLNLREERKGYSDRRT